MDTYIADTHSLIWFISEDDRLSKKAGRILEQAEESKVEVLIPTIVLTEITYIAEKKKVKITIDEVLECIQQGNGFAIVPFDLPVFQTLLKLPEDWEIHDRIISATACYYDAKLITKDKTLRKFDKIKTVW